MLLTILLAAALHAPRSDSLRPDEDIRDAVLRNSPDVRRCYEAEGLRRDATLRGTLELALTILPTGAVDSAAVQAVRLSSPAGRTEVASCVETAARHWRFERGPFGVERVVFPFRLAPVDQLPPKTPEATRLSPPDRAAALRGSSAGRS